MNKIKIVQCFIILILTIQIYLQKIVLFDYAIQSNIKNQEYYFITDKWQLTFWLKLYERIPQTEHTILNFSNDLEQKISLKIDIDNYISINDTDNKTYTIYQVVDFENFNLQILGQKKTQNIKWLKVAINYYDNLFDIFIEDQYIEISSFDFSYTQNGSINFFTSEQNCQIIYSNGELQDNKITNQNLDDQLNQIGLLGFYFFEYLSKSRQTVENLALYSTQPIYVEEYGQIPTSLFNIYNTNNFFSDFKLTYSNMWQSLVFYSLKMFMNFSLIFKQNLTEFQVQKLFNIILYQRTFQFSNIDQNQHTLETIFNLDFNIIEDLNNKSQYTFDSKFIYKFDIQTIETLFVEMQDTENQGHTYNFIYYMHLKTNYQIEDQNQNFFQFFLNDDQIIQYDSQVYFSKLDQHITYFHDENFLNIYFIVRIQEIIFYRDMEVIENNNYLDKYQQISMNCQIDNSEPIFQERFLINSNEHFVFKNCQKLKVFQRCDKYYKCIRCFNEQCMLCANEYYLVEGRCLKCIFPFQIVNGQCIMATKIFQYQIQNTPFNELSIYHTYLQDNLYEQNFIKFKIISLEEVTLESMEYFVINKDQQYGGLNQEQYLNKYFLNTKQNLYYYLQISVYSTNDQTNTINIYKTFQCLQQIQPNRNDIMICLNNCYGHYYNNDNQQLCQKNSQGCQINHNANENSCSQCQGGYTFFQTEDLQYEYCLPKSPANIIYHIHNNQINFNEENYLNNKYSYRNIQYDICDPSINLYQTSDQGCQNIQMNQGDYCNQLDQNGNCSSTLQTKITSGILKDQNDNYMYYFDLNKLQFLINQCQSQIIFDNQTEQIQLKDNKCVWQNHLDDNNKIQNCLFQDENCTQCDQNNLNKCSICQEKNLVNFQYNNKCGRKIPNCNVHITYRNQLMCESCEQNYYKVMYLLPVDYYGLCVNKKVLYCRFYELLEDDTIECKSCIQKHQLAFDLNRICVHKDNYAEFCINYILNQNNQYICNNCGLDTTCIDINGQIKNIDEQNQNLCYNCLPNIDIQNGCLSYRKDFKCYICQYNYHLQINGNCITYCSIFLNTESFNCIQCIDNYDLQNYYCYQHIDQCLIYNLEGCELCRQGYRIFHDINLISNICVEEIQKCILYQPENKFICSKCIKYYRPYNQENDYSICVQEIQNCQEYSIENQFKCQKCKNYSRIYKIQNYFDTCVSIIDQCIDYNQNNNQQCKKCHNNYQLNNNKNKCIYKKITKGYILQNEIENCQIINQNCKICKNQICIQCKENYILKQNYCELQKQYNYEEYLNNICQYNQPYCKICNIKNYLECNICYDGFDLSKNKQCIVINKNKNQQQKNKQEQFKQCQEYNQQKCLKCNQPFKLKNQKCQIINLPTQIIKEQDKIVNKCKTKTLCKNNQYYQNKHCKVCQQFCILQTDQYLNKINIVSNSQIKFSNKYFTTSQVMISYNENNNIIELELLDLFKKTIQISFIGNELISQSYNCIPQKIYQFQFNNEFQGLKKIGENQTNTKNIILGNAFNLLQFIFPQWTISYFVNSIQKLDTLGYLSYSNLKGGQVFDFINAFPEEQIQFINLKNNNNKGYQFEFDLQQYQQRCFNIINHSTLFTIISFILYIFWFNIYNTFKNRQLKLKDLFKLLIQKQKNEYYVQLRSLLMIQSIYLIPKINRFFVYQKSLIYKQQILLFAFDFIICYSILKKNYHHLYFQKFIDNIEDQVRFRIFDQQQDILFSFENQFNFWVVLNFSISIVSSYILYQFQEQFLKPFIMITLISLIFTIYLIKTFIKKDSILRPMIFNHILSEFLFITFTLFILVNQYTQYNFNIILNVIYILVNISKLAESFTIFYTIKQIKIKRHQNRNVLNLEMIQQPKFKRNENQNLYIKFNYNNKLQTIILPNDFENNYHHNFRNEKN